MIRYDMNDTDNCLSCLLDECNESHKSCAFSIIRRTYWTKINRKRRQTPEYCEKEYKALQAWRKTAKGKRSVKDSSKLYRYNHRKELRIKAIKYYYRIREKKNEREGI